MHLHKAINRLKNKLRPSVTKQVEKISKKYPGESLMIKYPREKVGNTTNKSTSTKVTEDIIKKCIYLRKVYNKRKDYNKKNNQEMHTHRFEGAVPSPVDIYMLMERYLKDSGKTETIYIINNKDKVIGSTHITFGKKVSKELFEKIKRIISEEGELNPDSLEIKINHLFRELILKNKNIDLNDPKLKKQRAEIMCKMMTGTTNYMKSLLEVYLKSGLKLRFLPREGYIFDRKRIEFRKK